MTTHQNFQVVFDSPENRDYCCAMFQLAAGRNNVCAAAVGDTSALFHTYTGGGAEAVRSGLVARQSQGVVKSFECV